MSEDLECGNSKRNTGSIVRRDFISAVTATAVIGGAVATADAASATALSGKRPEKFKMKFAPHPGSFRASFGNNILDEIKYCHDQGFSAIEFNGLPNQSVEMQQKIGDLLTELGMTMGVFVAYANFVEPTFAQRNEDKAKEILQALKASVEVAKRVNAKWMTVVPGSIDQPVAGGNKYGGPRMAEGYQLGNTIDLLRRCAEVLEPHDLVMVLEPLNWHANHGGTLLRYSDQAYAICRAVNSQACKILFDIYHQQITEGNLITNIDQCWDEIAYFQAGDNPGRKEPGTGEINYVNVFKHIHERASKEGRDFVIGMEHGNSINGKEGEAALIAAYRAVDPA
jgi:hydroxypyruvate isomerase